MSKGQSLSDTEVALVRGKEALLSLIRYQSLSNINSSEVAIDSKRLRQKWDKEYRCPGRLRSRNQRQKSLDQDIKAAIGPDLAYKYGRMALVLLAVFSIPVDAWKMVDGIMKADTTLDGPGRLEILEYYSASMTTHVIGMSAAFDNRLIITIGCRLLSTILYHSGVGVKNSTVPTDPKELQKYIKENVPAHRLPKGYRFQNLENIKTTSSSSRRKRSRKKKKESFEKKGSRTTSTKKASDRKKSKPTTKKPVKNTKLDL